MRVTIWFIQSLNFHILWLLRWDRGNRVNQTVWTSNKMTVCINTTHEWQGMTINVTFLHHCFYDEFIGIMEDLLVAVCLEFVIEWMQWEIDGVVLWMGDWMDCLEVCVVRDWHFQKDKNQSKWISIIFNDFDHFTTLDTSLLLFF